MLNHPTSKVVTEDALVGVVLVGPPAAGKTTVRRLMGDLGVVTCDVRGEYRGPDDDEHGWKEVARETAQEAGKMGVCCVEGLRTQEEVEWFSGLVRRHLVLRIDTRDQTARMNRFIERELEQELDMVSESRIADLRQQFHRREYDSGLAPYPKHHAIIMNDDSLSTTALFTQLSGLLSALTGVLDDVDPVTAHAKSD